MEDRKDRLVATLLAFFLGGFGIHKFYLGRIFPGILYLLFFWTSIPFFLGVIDAIFLITMNQKRFDIVYNSSYFKLIPKDEELMRRKESNVNKKDVYCPNCGNANEWNYAFCGHCGTKATSKSTADEANRVYCSKCGNPNSIEDTFCSQCGEMLSL